MTNKDEKMNENPKDVLVSLDKVCDYLGMRIDEYIIRDLRKTMEKQYMTREEQIKQEDSKPKKFDLSTLKPFESKVLVRDYINSDEYDEYDEDNSDEDNSDVWRPAIWGVYIKDNLYPFWVQGGCYFKCCIPYEGNEHLSGKTEDCDDFYRNW